MSTTDNPWGDTGFESGDDGFRRNSGPDAPTPQPDTQQAAGEVHVPASGDVNSAERIRIEPIPSLPKIVLPSATQRRSRSLIWITVAALGALIVAGGGVAWYLTSRSVQEEAFIANEELVNEPQQTEEPLQQEAAPGSAAEPLVETMPAKPDASKKPKQAQTVEPRKQPMQNTSQIAAQSEQTAPHIERLNLKREIKTRPDIKTTPSNTSASGPAWVVQVFASPSRDDAEEWLQQLREQRIPDGYIVEQKVKGESWYRVRFGQFSSRTEAEQAAQSRGFAQPWIARVR